MEEIYSRVYKIDTIGHIIVAVVFSIMCIVLYFGLKKGTKQKTQKNFITNWFIGVLIFLFIITIFEIYFGTYSRTRFYQKPISCGEYFERLPKFLSFTLILFAIGSIVPYIVTRHEEKLRKKKETEKNKIEKNKI